MFFHVINNLKSNWAEKQQNSVVEHEVVQMIVALQASSEGYNFGMLKFINNLPPCKQKISTAGRRVTCRGKLSTCIMG